MVDGKGQPSCEPPSKTTLPPPPPPPTSHPYPTPTLPLSCRERYPFSDNRTSGPAHEITSQPPYLPSRTGARNGPIISPSLPPPSPPPTPSPSPSASPHAHNRRCGKTKRLHFQPHPFFRATPSLLTHSLPWRGWRRRESPPSAYTPALTPPLLSPALFLLRQAAVIRSYTRGASAAVKSSLEVSCHVTMAEETFGKRWGVRRGLKKHKKTGGCRKPGEGDERGRERKRDARWRQYIKLSSGGGGVWRLERNRAKKSMRLSEAGMAVTTWTEPGACKSRCARGNAGRPSSFHFSPVRRACAYPLPVALATNYLPWTTREKSVCLAHVSISSTLSKRRAHSQCPCPSRSYRFGW